MRGRPAELRTRSFGFMPLSASVGHTPAMWRSLTTVPGRGGSMLDGSERSSADWDMGSSSQDAAGPASTSTWKGALPGAAASEDEDDRSLRQMVVWTLVCVALLWLVYCPLVLSFGSSPVSLPNSVLRDLKASAASGDISAQRSLAEILTSDSVSSGTWLVHAAIESEPRMRNKSLGGKRLELDVAEQVVLDGPAKLSDFVLTGRRNAMATLLLWVVRMARQVAVLLGGLPGVRHVLLASWHVLVRVPGGSWAMGATSRAGLTLAGRAEAFVAWLSPPPALVVLHRSARFSNVTLSGVRLISPGGASLPGVVLSP